MAVSRLIVPDCGAVMCDHNVNLLPGDNCWQCKKDYRDIQFHLVKMFIVWTLLAVVCIAFWVSVIITVLAVVK